ncbi:hypothetical protein [Denitromonas sp.]|uniref:hypothetical protein n=1 Tax=Denitromonas sp. TaxID=2734609 RepID=UPI002AFDFE5D|nr:hypothetical protein [Denitromonas sp.]
MDSVEPSKHQDPDIRVRSDHLLRRAGYRIDDAVGPYVSDALTPALKNWTTAVAVLCSGSGAFWLYFSGSGPAHILSAAMNIMGPALLIMAVGQLLLTSTDPAWRSKPTIVRGVFVCACFFLNYLLWTPVFMVVVWALM